jgi:hypothetical protein
MWLRPLHLLAYHFDIGIAWAHFGAQRLPVSLSSVRTLR